MTAYRVELSGESRESLRRFDKQTVERILRKIDWLSQNFDSLTPEALTGDFKGLLKLRVGDYRVAYEAKRLERLIVVHFIRHRSEAYKQP